MKKRFYDLDALHSHLRLHHEKCYICARQGKDNQYFRNYNQLEKHFRSAHYLCENPRCLADKHVVFADSIDLLAHQQGCGWCRTADQQAAGTKIRIEFRVRREGRGGGGYDADDGQAVFGRGAEVTNDRDDIASGNFDFGLDGRAFVPPQAAGA